VSQVELFLYLLLSLHMSVLFKCFYADGQVHAALVRFVKHSWQSSGINRQQTASVSLCKAGCLCAPTVVFKCLWACVHMLTCSGCRCSQCIRYPGTNNWLLVALSLCYVQDHARCHIWPTAAAEQQQRSARILTVHLPVCCYALAAQCCTAARSWTFLPWVSS
jgi:hypothetical protein